MLYLDLKAMRKGNRTDWERFSEIMNRAYATNPSVLWVLKNDSVYPRRLRILTRYCFEKGLANDGIWFTEDFAGVSVVFELQHEKQSWRSLYWEIVLAMKGITIPRLKMVMKRDALIRKKRDPQTGLYFWMYAADPDKMDGVAARKMRDYFFHWADESGQFILAETSVPKNERVYRYSGFETYDEWRDEKSEMITWMMRRAPRPKQN